MNRWDRPAACYRPCKDCTEVAAENVSLRMLDGAMAGTLRPVCPGGSSGVRTSKTARAAWGGRTPHAYWFLARGTGAARDAADLTSSGSGTRRDSRAEGVEVLRGDPHRVAVAAVTLPSELKCNLERSLGLVHRRDAAADVQKIDAVLDALEHVAWRDPDLMACCSWRSRLADSSSGAGITPVCPPVHRRGRYERMAIHSPAPLHAPRETHTSYYWGVGHSTWNRAM